MFGTTTRKVNYRAAKTGKKYGCVNLPEEAILGKKVLIIQLDEKSLLLKFE